MSHTVTAATGRTYNGPQVLQITVEAEQIDEYGLHDITATFKDNSRNIQGRAKVLIVFPQELGPAVLSAYDAGQYEQI